MKRLLIPFMLLVFLLLSMACENTAVDKPSINEFSIALLEEGATSPLQDGSEITNGATLVFTVDAEGDHVIINTPLEAIKLSEVVDLMPVEEEYTFLNDTLGNETISGTFTLVATNVYDHENIERTEKSIKLSVKGTTKSN